jgi:hypothetical protein
MLQITKGQANTVVISKELTTVSDPYYLFVFISNNEVETSCIASSGTVYGNRQAFTITEVSSGATRTNGQITLPAGEYAVEVWAQASSSNLTRNTSNELIKACMAKVSGTAEVTFVSNTNSINYISNGG